ncbi:MAG: TrbC/VirB2 family protein, partial [Rickettsiaceae bacterium]|nr:TrbC/VirB2 family protein [Rickettsiaceae bacterium]
FVSGLLLISDSAFATAVDTLGTNLCAVLAVMQSTTGKAVAIIAIIGGAFAFLTGNIKWTTLLMLATGIITIFSASSMVNLLSNASDTAATTNCSTS